VHLQAQRQRAPTAAVDAKGAAGTNSASDGTSRANGAGERTSTAGAASAADGMSAVAAAAASRCNPYVLAKWGIFSIEDLKGRQTDVRDFLFTQNKSPYIVLR